MNNNILKQKFKEASNLVFTWQYLKNYQKIFKKHKTAALKKLLKIINELKTFDITTQYHNHILSDGKTYELHVEKDILLLYRYEGKDLYIDLILLNLTNHKRLKQKLEDDLDVDWFEGDYEYCDYSFARELFALMSSFIPNENINEAFKDKKSLARHFAKHCVGAFNKKSSKTNVLYDFTKMADYSTYEKYVIGKLNDDNLIIVDSLGDVIAISKAFRLFFEGNKALLFSATCGFNNNGKSVSLLLYSYSSDVTLNYKNNTVTLDVISKKITRTLYPIDADYLQTKLNNIIEKYTGQKTGIKINNPKDAANSIPEYLDENIEKHNELNPLLFNGDELKPEVVEAVDKIAKKFVEDLKADGIKFDLEDVILVGSNVSYNYTKDSDLDIHLIASSENLKCPDKLYPLLYSAYRSIFNNNYDFTINGIPAEIYVEMDKPSGKSNGVYSIYDGWLKHPVQEDIPEVDQEAFDKLFSEWEDKYFELIGTDNDLLNESNETDLIVYNASNDLDFSDLNKSKELGIHCGTLAAAKEIQKAKKYGHIYKLILSNPKIIKADNDYEAIWDPYQIISKDDSLLKDFSKEEKNDLLDKCRNIDYPNKYEKRSALLRNALIPKGYNLIEYVNQIEDKGSKSYIILDPNIIKKVGKI